jgi:type IV secretory pathway VirB2 component (pilin)
MGIELHTTRLAVVMALPAFVAQQAKQSSPATPPQATLDQILTRLDAIERRLPS